MSYSRTSLLRLELVTGVVGLAFSFGALVSGIYGMNLKTEIFEFEGWFGMVVVGISLACIAIVVGSFLIFRRGKHHYRKYCEQFGRNVFFSNLADDGYVLQLT